METQNHSSNDPLHSYPTHFQQVETFHLPHSLNLNSKTPTIFIVCSRIEEDMSLYNRLQRGLSYLQRSGKINLWHEAMSIPGRERQQEIDIHLEHASLILLLLSPDFFHSDECVMMQQRALEKQRLQEASVIPILLRPCDWEDMFKSYTMLPTNHEPVTLWANLDQAFLDIVRGLRRMIEEALMLPYSQCAPDTIATDQEQDLPTFWHMPYRRNPFFTGREQILSRLHDLLTTQMRATLTQALTGLGGTGKTQTAIEYAYRYQHDYTAVFWVGADTHEALLTCFVMIARSLKLSIPEKQDQQGVVRAVLQWFNTHTRWLLIFDDVQEIDMLQDFFPQRETGHILITTRRRAVGAEAEALEIEKMPIAEATLFLLRRAKIMRHNDPIEAVSEAEQAHALAIAEALDGLPLALDQAGAYIEETGCSLAQYLERYAQRRAELLKKRGRNASGHPASVTTTFLLCFEKVAQVNPAATDLLRCCALLHPDDIPEELLKDGAAELGPVLRPVAADPFSFDEALADLLYYSLIQRSVKTNTISIHRLVQAVLIDEMGESLQRTWAERVIKALCNVFPAHQTTSWQHLQRYLAHVQACVMLIERWEIHDANLTDWLLDVGHYVENSGFYSLAEALYVQRNRLLKNELSGMMDTLFGASWDDYVNNVPATEMLSSISPLPQLYYHQGKYKQAEEALQRAIMFIEQIQGPEHILLVELLNTLGALYYTVGNYKDAEALLQRSLNIHLHTPSTDLNGLARCLNNLAELYRKQGKYDQAEPLYQQAIQINETQFGSTSIEIADITHNMALLYRAQKKYTQAETFYLRALSIYEKAYGPESPALATALNSLGVLYSYQEKYDKVEALLLKALSIREKVLGTEHSDVARTLNNLGNLYQHQGKYEQAHQILQRSLHIYTQQFGAEHPETAMALTNLGFLHMAQNQYVQAESMLAQAFNIYEKTIGLQGPETFIIFKSLFITYTHQKKAIQAHKICQRILPALRERLGHHHKDVQVIEELQRGLSQKIQEQSSKRYNSKETNLRLKNNKKRKRNK